MSKVVDTLEKSVGAAVTAIMELQDRVALLERELSEARAAARAAAAPPPAPPAPPVDPKIVEELQRLRTERVVVRDRIRELLGELDRVCR